MKNYIILSGRPTFAPEWEEIGEKAGNLLILIANSSVYTQVLNKKQSTFFYQIYKTDDFSVENLSHIVEKIFKNNVNFIKDNTYVVTNEEFCLIPCAKLREQFKLSGDRLSDVIPFREKNVMKEVLIAKNMNSHVPKYVLFSYYEYKEDTKNYVTKIINYLGFPIFAKPTNLSSGKYAKILRNDVELTTFCSELKEADSFELDEYVSGELYHIDSIVKDNNIIFAQVNRYLNPMFDFTFGKPTGSILLEQSDPDFKIFLDFNHKILSSFNKIPDGITHLEAFKTPDNRLIFVEVAARPPGGLVKHCYQKYFDIDIFTLHYKLQMGIFNELKINYGEHYAWIWFPQFEGRVAKINHPQGITSNYVYEPKVIMGEVIQDIKPWVFNIACTLILSNKDYQVLIKDFDSFSEYKAITVDNSFEQDNSLVFYNPNKIINQLEIKPRYSPVPNSFQKNNH